MTRTIAVQLLSVKFGTNTKMDVESIHFAGLRKVLARDRAYW